MPTYPNEIWPADAVVESLDGTIDAATGLPYIAKGTGPTSLPSLQVQYNRREQRCNAVLAGWRQGMVIDEGSFHVGVYPIRYALGGQYKSFDGATGVAVPADASKMIYLNSANALVVADAWPADLATFLPLATVDTHNGHTTIADARGYAVFNV